MIQASARWVSNRVGTYKTVTLEAEAVSTEIGEILLRGTTGDLFSLLLGRRDLATLCDTIADLLSSMDRLA